MLITLKYSSSWMSYYEAAHFYLVYWHILHELTHKWSDRGLGSVLWKHSGSMVILHWARLDLCFSTILSKHSHPDVKDREPQNEKSANKTVSHQECQKPAAQVGINSATIWTSSRGVQSNSSTGYGIIWYFLQCKANCWVNCHANSADLKGCTNVLK